MADVRLAHTGELAPSDLRSARSLLYEVFSDMTEHDWEHALGGIHAIAREGNDIVGHASLVMRRLLQGGRALRVGYVEGVAVREDRRGQGLGAALMAPLERLIRSAYDLGALGATDEAAHFYTHRGWLRWRGLTFALSPTGIMRTPDDDDSTFVLPCAGGDLDLTGDLVCDWRDGDMW